MNRIHRLVWNAARRLWVPAAETVRARGGKSRSARVGAVVIGVCGLGVAGSGWAACTDDPLVGASANGGSACTTTSATYSGGDLVLGADGSGTVLDASGVSQVDATGSGTAIGVSHGAQLKLGTTTLNFNGHEEGLWVEWGGQLVSTGKLTINYLGGDFWPGALHIVDSDDSTAELNDLTITVNTSGTGTGEPSDGIGLLRRGTLTVGGDTRVDMSGSKYRINPGLAFYHSGGNARFLGKLDIVGPDAAIFLAGEGSEGSEGPNSYLSATGGGTVEGGIAAINVIDRASGTLAFKDLNIKGGRNAFMVACAAYAAGCTDYGEVGFYGGGTVDALDISLNGGSATGPNVLYVHQPESHITLNASNSAALNGNVVTATDSAGTNTPTDIHLASGATLTGAVMGGGGSAGSEAGNATLPANIALNLANATWILTGPSHLKTLGNGAGGKVDFGNFSGSYKTLTVKDYAGGGDITFNAFLGDSRSPSDKLVIDGGSATGSSRVWVRNTGGLGAQTTGNGILLVEAINGGTTAPSAFALGQAVIAGAYDYSLRRAGESWYLSSEFTHTPAPPPPPPQPPAPAPAPAPAQNFRAETRLYAALPSQALMGMGQALVVPTAPPPPPVAVKVAAADANSALTALAEREQALAEPQTWVRLLGTQAHNKAEGQSANGANWAQFKADTELLQVGRRVAQSTQGAASRSVSVVGALGAVSGDVTHINAAGVGGIAGSNKVEIAALGAALSQRFDATYLDAVAQISHLRARSSSVRGLGFKTSGTGLAAAVEAGQRLNLSPGWGWQPHATLRLAQANLGNTQDAAGQVRFESARSVQAGLGVTLQTTDDRTTQLHATVRLLHEFAGKSGTVVADASGNNGQIFHASTRGSALQLKAGVEHRVSGGAHLFATVNHTQGLNAGNKKSSDTGVSLGVKFNW